MENQDMLQIIEMLAKLDAKQEKAEANRKAYQEKAKADRKADRKTEKEELKAAMRSMWSELDEAIQQRIEWIKARTEAMRRDIGSSHMEMVSAFKPKIEEETMACRESTETRLEGKKPTSPDRKPEAAQKEEVLTENAEVIPVGEPRKKWRKDRKLAMERRRQKLMDLTRENCRPQKKLAVAHRGTSHRVEVARKMQTNEMPVVRQWHDA
jgi:hypothetical protein